MSDRERIQYEVNGLYHRVVEHTKSPAYTRYFGVGAIYAINPCSEEFARKAASQMSAPMKLSCGCELSEAAGRARRGRAGCGAAAPGLAGAWQGGALQGPGKARAA